jgi:hypothetical protein
MPDAGMRAQDIAASSDETRLRRCLGIDERRERSRSPGCRGEALGGAWYLISLPAWLPRQDLEQHLWTHRQLPCERPVMGGDQHD